MRLVPMLLAVAFVISGCAVQQGMRVTRSAHYDERGKLTGYTVEETLLLPKVSRPLDRAMPDIDHFETGNTRERDTKDWPPRRVHR